MGLSSAIFASPRGLFKFHQPVIRVIYDSSASQYGRLRLASNSVEIKILPADARK